MKYKIVKQIHTYQKNTTNFVIYKKILFGLFWVRILTTCTFEGAENAIIEKFHSTGDGIIEINNNIYSFEKTSFSV